jgi:pyridoxal phosphate enzyme (YggS family)
MISHRYSDIQSRIKSAAEASGRDAATVTLMAVTKTVPVDQIVASAQLGINAFGENRVQEAIAKRDDLIVQLSCLGLNPSHHLIGHLQTNKARKAVELFDVIQTVDRPELAATLDRIAGEKGTTVTCLVEVKVSSEPTKSGVPFNDASDFLKSFKTYAHLKVKGLMTIAPLDVAPEETRTCFKNMFHLFTAHQEMFGDAPVLSMGMSDDFETAIEEGSNMVRIGRAIFG